ncbi:MAG: hypothetical protein E7618_01565 [Ruminococcaceae bacterium]|nr:hypothetical protein [Oscillospiraceae bacterium]
MHNYSSFFKRAQAWVVAVAILLTVVNPLFGLSVFATDDVEPTGEVSTTDGKIVAGNYNLTDAEKELLGSGLLVGATHTYKVPTASDNLISVDTETKTITVLPYEGTDGYPWEPTVAKLIVNDAEHEVVTLVNGVGTYAYTGNAFKVEAEFELRIDIDEDTQSLLLQAPSILTEGLSNLNTANGTSGDIGVIQEMMPHLVQLAGDGIPVNPPVNVFGFPLSVLRFDPKDFDNKKAIAAVTKLNSQMTENGGVIDLIKMLNEYDEAPSKVQYLMENGEALKAKIAETRDDFYCIKNTAFFGDTLLNALKNANSSYYTIFSQAHRALTSAISALETLENAPWTALSTNVLKDGLTTTDYQALDILVAKVIANTVTEMPLAFKNPLLVSTAKVQFNMSMYDVNVKVVLALTDPDSLDVKYVEYGSTTNKLTLVKDATKAEILAAVEEAGFVNAALTKWADEGAYVDGKFHQVTTELPETLTEDVDYVITVQPNLYKVTYQYLDNSVVNLPYGYDITLEKHDDGTKAYDYDVDGTYYAQGDTHTVVADTVINREVGKSYTTGMLYTILAGNYLGAGSKAILTSGALAGDVAVNVRYPDNNNGLVTLDGNKLTAGTYAASYEGLSWAPYSYTLSNGQEYYFGGNNTVVIDEPFTNVKVTYRLALTNFDKAWVLDVANLPDVLVGEAAAQLAALKRIAAQRDNLETMNRTMMGFLKGLIADTKLNDNGAKNDALKESFTDALDKILADCYGATNSYLYDIVDAYYIAETKTLRSDSEILMDYYSDYEHVRAEIGKFAALMSQLLGEEVRGGVTLTAQDKMDALAAMMRTLPSNIVAADKVDEYVAKLTTLESTMNGVYNDLSVPNAAILLDSPNLGTLTAALTSGKATDSFATIEAPYLTDSNIVMIADNMVAIQVTLQIAGGETVTITSDSLYENEQIDDTLIKKLVSDIEKELKRQNVVGTFYHADDYAAVLNQLIGTEAGSLETSSFTFNWTYKNFTVQVPGMADQTVNYVDRVINLPASADVAYRYDYYINGVQVSSGNRTLSESELTLIAKGAFTVTREEIFILEDNLVKYVNALNAAIGSDELVFVLVEKSNGEYAIVLKVASLAPDSLMDAAMGMATGMVQGSYPYIGIENQGFLNDGKVYLQTLIDAVMNSGLGMETLVSLMDNNGNIINMKLPGTTVLSDKPLAALGGQLMQTTMQLGTTVEDAVSVDFYLTLGASNEQLVQIRELYMSQLSQYFDLVLENGRVNVKLNLPEKAYEAFLASLLITGKLDLSNMNDVNGEIAISFINEMLIPMFESGVTLKSFENTMAMFGIDLDLSSKRGVAAAFNEVVAFYTGATFEYDDISGTAYGTVDIEGAIDKMNLGVLGNIIAEKETGITLGISIALEDLGKDYEALFVDINAAGITNKIGLVTNLSHKLDDIAGTAAIVLLSDIEGTLTFDTTTLLNLNGFTVHGGLVANGKVIVVDSHVQNNKNGTVTDKVSGNAIIVGGEYKTDVSAFIKNGYAQDANGVVTNNFYDIVEDENDNITIKLNAEMIHTDSIPELACLVVDIACDLLFNGYSCNYLEIDGNTIYNITLSDLVGLYASSNRLKSVASEVMDMVDPQQLFALMNTVLDDVLDFTAISEAIAADAPIFEYSMVRKPWGIAFEHMVDGDYVTASIVSGTPVKEGNFSIVVEGDAADKQYLVDLFAELGEITTADLNVYFDGYDYANANLTLSFRADGNVFVDVSSPEYSVMFCTILADGIGAPANADLVAGIKEYYATGDISKLSLAFNALTTAQAITAIKNVARDESFTSMVAALGLTDVVDADVVELESLYDRFGKVAAALVRRADLTGGSRLLGSFLDKDGIVSISRENVSRLISASFRGYTVSADVSVTSAYVGVKFFETNLSPIDYTELNDQIKRAEALNAEDYTEESWAKVEAALEEAYKALESIKQDEVDTAAGNLKTAIDKLEKKPTLEPPYFEDGTGTPTISSDKVYGYKVVYDGMYIIIDADINGITVEELERALDFVTYHGEGFSMEFELTKLGERNGMVGTGTVVTAYVDNLAGSAEVSYTIIILGDLTGDGMNKMNDSSFIGQAVVGKRELSEIEKLAADVNNNGRVDIGDAARNARKVFYTEEYKSFFGKEN